MITHNFTGTYGFVSDIAISNDNDKDNDNDKNKGKDDDNKSVSDDNYFIAEGDEKGKIVIWRGLNIIDENTPFAELNYEGQVYDVQFLQF